MLVKKISFISFVLFISCSSNKDSNKRLPISNFNGLKIGFASCLNQERKMPIFNTIKAESLDLFLMMGDNVYGNSTSENLNELREAYDKQKQNFDKLDFDFPIEAIWDDNDYGLGDGGKEYYLKEKSKELFLDFWDVSNDDPRTKRSGLYHEIIKDYEGKSIQILFLDTRTFRDNLKPSDDKGAIGKERYVPFPDTSLTMLGIEQWQWLAQKISKPVNYRFIVSSIQFLALGHGWECWNNLPYERQRLIDLIDKSNIDHTVLLSGDRHRGGFYQLKTNSNKIISEMTSSSLNVPYSNPEELGPLRIGSTYSKENYGVIQLGESQDSISVMLKNIKGEVLTSFRL
ncbi:MAG: alkaline phosphatase D family protein [bacterium]